MSLRLALIVQRYGEEVSGGAELMSRWLAEKLTQLGQVDVLTTCALDYTTWANHYPPGKSTLNGVNIHRFPVDAPRDWPREQKATGRFLMQENSVLDEWLWMSRQGPNSTPLLRAIEAAYPRYNAFLFTTFLYGQTFFGLPLVPDKALLIPTAHDDPFLRMPVFRSLFHLPRFISYLTYAERDLVQEVTRNGRVPSEVIGIGINPPSAPADPARFRQKFGLAADTPFILYVGRLAPSKNVPELLDYFLAYKKNQPSSLKLVLMGKGDITIPQHPDLVQTGFVTEQEKFDGLAASSFVVVPSIYESLSMLALEGWLMGKPVLVNGHCTVLKQQCRRSNAGLYYWNEAEFGLLVDYLLAHPVESQLLGRAGQRFVAENYSWDVVLGKYETALNAFFVK